MNILHLEDSASDAELVHEFLKVCWPELEAETVSRRQDFERAVCRGNYDIIISDYSIPGYSGLEALTFARKHAPEKPFIYLSGTIGEERAITALKAGASDYVIKDRPARLIPAIETALAQVDAEKRGRKADEKIRQQASLLDQSREAICVLDANRKVTYWNASAHRLYGWSVEEAMGKDLRELLYAHEPGQFDAALENLRAKGEWRGELSPAVKEDGNLTVESFWSLVTNTDGLLSTILICDADITDRKRMESQLMQTQRLETLGLLAGGIAHDLNNVLAPILTSVDILSKGATGEKDRSLLGTLEASVQHGTELVRQLLAFARGKGTQRTSVAIDTLVGSVQRLLEHVMPPTIKVSASLPGMLSHVEADSTQLRQVLLNLCINARDAMPEGGSVTIRAEDVQTTTDTPSLQGEAQAGPHVCISVIDTGSGIPPHVVAKLFDPFFTTKKAGKGTGLGLANVAGIVKAHGGFVGLESVVGKGTTFHIYLPAVAAPAIREPETPAATSESITAGVDQDILVIEDDEAIRALLEIILSSGGYRVALAADGQDGLRQLASHPETKLVITDLHLPGMSGSDIVRNLKGLPNVPRVIVLSGLTPEEDEIPSDWRDVEFLGKPVGTQVLLKTVGRILQNGAASEPNGTRAS
jgi:PAS domain S-box-containing protein